MTASGSGFTQEQYQGLLSLLQPSNLDSCGSSHLSNLVHTTTLHTHSPSSAGIQCDQWLIDTGAYDHKTFNLANFLTFSEIFPIPITLRDGSKTHANISGIVHLLPSLTLKNVLYIPDFKVNIISTAKLIFDSNCFLIFNSAFSFIKQTLNRKTISTAKQLQGLYVLMSQVANPLFTNSTHSLCAYYG